MPLPTTEQEWDLQSGDGYQFDAEPQSNTVAKITRIKDSSLEVKQLSNELSKKILGYEAKMNTGYAYDYTGTTGIPYNGNSVAHAGIDYQASAGRNVSVIVPGTIINVTKDSAIGQFVTVEGNDGK